MLLDLEHAAEGGFTARFLQSFQPRLELGLAIARERVETDLGQPPWALRSELILNLEM